MKKSFMHVSQVLHLCKPEQQLLIAEQEKALCKEEFEQSRHRLMQATRRVQDLKATLHFTERKEACNG